MIDGCDPMHVLELFSGAGLATEGLLAAGLDVVRCIEFNENADATAKLWRHPSVHGDVRDLSLYEGLPGSIDLMWASPPCQAFSLAGKRLGSKDERNGWPWTFDVIDRVQPRWVATENVVGLIHHKDDCPPGDCAGCYWESVVRDFERRYVHVSWRVLDAADYGVPQRRRRVFLVAGPKPFYWPEPTHSRSTLARMKWVTGEYWRELGITKRGVPSTDEARWIPRGVWDDGLPRWRTFRDVIDLPENVGWCSIVNQSALDYRVVKSADIPINTVTAGSEISHGGNGFAVTFGYAEGEVVPLGLPYLKGGDTSRGLRRLLVDESARLMGLPSGKPFVGNLVAQRQQVGNGCCPPVVEAIGRAVLASEVSIKPVKAQVVLDFTGGSW